jgi:hypothetical protein
MTLQVPAKVGLAYTATPNTEKKHDSANGAEPAASTSVTSNNPPMTFE